MSQTETTTSLSTVDTQATPAIVGTFQIANVVWMPTSPPRPAPEVMTTDDVVIFLRLGKGGHRTVRHYVATGQLKAGRIGKPLRFLLADVQAFAKSRCEGKN